MDILIVETIFDTLNAKAALFAIDEFFEARGLALPVMISGTITDASGRTLRARPPRRSGTRCGHAPAASASTALSVRRSCARTSTSSRGSRTAVSAYPNAGLPNEFGGYDETPTQIPRPIHGEWAEYGLVNLVGGCCGTTPAHIGPWRTLCAACRRAACATPTAPPKATPSRAAA